MKVIFKILFCIAFLGSFSNSNAQMQTGSFEFEGRTRNYEVYLPQNFQSNMPLVIALHGWSETIDWFKNYTLLHQFADTAGFIVVYPEGIGRSWNIGIISGPIRGTFPTVDDVGFISALIDTLYNHYTIDMQRIYCCGFSTGGEMTYRLAIELGYRFAAVASVAGGLYDPAENWYPMRPMPVLHIHGTKDQYSFYYHSDDTFKTHSAEEWSIKKSLDYWIERNQCSSMGDTIAMPDLNTGDFSTVQKITFSECSDNTEVIHFKIIDGGHVWPGSAFSYSGEGNKNKDINANEKIWNFFKNYQNPYTTVAYAKSIEVYTKYMPPQQGDTLKLSAQISNPQNHQVTVQALIQGNNNTFKDSLQLFDDGLHNDNLASDNIFGGIKSLDALDEDYFDIQLRTTDLNESLTSYYNRGHFTTIGPLRYDNYYFFSGTDTIPDPGDRIYVYLTLRNNGSTAPATGVGATISSADPCVSGIVRNNARYGDIPAGEAVTGTGSNYFFIDISDDCPGGLDIKFALSIDRQGYPLWSDSFSIYVYEALEVAEEGSTLPTEFALHQNYPNPFNPVTNLRFDLPETMEITMTVYDILGREVALLARGRREAGYHQQVWDGRDRDGREVPTGIYFVLVVTPEFRQSIKVVLLK